MTRVLRGGCVALLITAGTLVAPGMASGAGETAAPTTWPAPGFHARAAQPLPVTAKVGTVQPITEPLTLIGVDLESRAGASFSINSDILFATGSSDLGTDSAAALKELAETMSEAGVSGPAKVIGHTDDVGSDAANLALSQRRAKAVTAALKGQLSNTGITLSAQGVGESAPIAKGTTDSARARNRRVNVVFTQKAAPEEEEDQYWLIGVPADEPAPAAPGGRAPEGSLAATQRDVIVGSEHERWTIRLDVTGVKPLGSELLALDLQTTVIAGPQETFRDQRALFTGSTRDSQLRIALYDRAGGSRQLTAISGEGEALATGFGTDVPLGKATASSFLLAAPPKAGEPLELFIPAFGVLNVPLDAAATS